MEGAWRDDYLRSVCGFANAEGGVLHIGRNDQGLVVGEPDAARLLEELPNKIRDLLGVVAQVNRHDEPGAVWLEIVVPAYPAPISYRGHYYQRVGSTNQELRGAALDRFLLSRYGRTWDGSPLPGVSVADLSKPALFRFRGQAERSGRLDNAALAVSDAELLDKLKLTEGAYLKRAAVLLFHPSPLAFVTGAFVKIGFFRTASELIYQDEIAGDLSTQSRQTIDLLVTKYLKAVVTYEGIVRVERLPVPRAALREAVLNALVHRDYSVPTPVQVRVYEDRLSIWNPAVLPDGWTLETLLRPHGSQPFNPNIANAFFRAGEIEAWGRGIERIFDACREARISEPRIRFDGGLWIEFDFSREYLRSLRSVSSGDSDEVTPEVTRQRLESRLESQLESLLAAKVLLALHDGEAGKARLAGLLGHKSVSGELHKQTRRLLNAGWIEMTLPEKPNSRLQKYRLTPRGETLLASLFKGVPNS